MPEGVLFLLSLYLPFTPRFSYPKPPLFDFIVESCQFYLFILHK